MSDWRKGFQKPSWVRGGGDLVAVNPERITTLLDLASEHYNGRCARCNAKTGKSYRRPIVHHRHYRTLGFERPGEDIVLLCKGCHDDLHARAKERLLNKSDIPFVDPEWEPALRTKRTQDEINAEWPEGVYNPSAYKRADMRTFEIVIQVAPDKTETMRLGYPSIEIARKEADAMCAYHGHLSVVSVAEAIQ